MKKMIYIILLINGLLAYGQTAVKDVYEFPLKPGSEQWRQLSIKERKDALQIPERVLTKISTEGLLESCLRFPYLGDIFLGDDYQQGFEWLTAEFNGFRELFKRRDLTDVLLKKYGSLTTEVTGIRLLTSIEQGKFTFRHFALEWMLAQDTVCRNLSPEQEKQLFFLSFEHKKIKRQYVDIFGNLNDVPANLLYAKKVMADPNFTYKSMEQRNALSDFIQSPVWIEPQAMESVEDFITAKFK